MLGKILDFLLPLSREVCSEKFFFCGIWIKIYEERNDSDLLFEVEPFVWEIWDDHQLFVESGRCATFQLAISSAENWVKEFVSDDDFDGFTS